jgi:Ion channel
LIVLLGRIQTICERFADQCLSALLALQLVLIFVAGPLASVGVELPLKLTKALTAALIIALVLGFRRRGVLAAAIVAGGIRVAAAAGELVEPSSTTAAMDGTGAALLLLIVMWIVLRVVFAPGPITSHRVRGAIVLYLAIAVAFSWIYLVIAALVPNAFSGVTFRVGDLTATGSLVYYSLTMLTTVGFGHITPLSAVARTVSMSEAVIGQLFPAIILARILTLYSDERKRTD